MEPKNIKKYFRFVRTNIDTDTYYKLWSIDETIKKYFKFATKYCDLKYLYNNSSCHISNNFLTNDIEIISEFPVMLDNRKLFFEFPDDYPEEKLFYFSLKFDVKMLT